MPRPTSSAPSLTPPPPSPRAVGSVPLWYVPGGGPPAPSRRDVAQLSRERCPLPAVLARAPLSYNLARGGACGLFVGRSGPWRSARTSASPRAARKAPRRKCKGGRERRRRGPGRRGGRMPWMGGGWRRTASGPLLSWRRPGAGFAWVRAELRGGGGTGRGGTTAAVRARVPARPGFLQPRRVLAAPAPGRASMWGALRGRGACGRARPDPTPAPAPALAVILRPQAWRSFFAVEAGVLGRRRCRLRCVWCVLAAEVKK